MSINPTPINASVIRKMLEEYTDNRNNPSVIPKSVTTLENLGFRTDVDSLLFSSDATTIVVVTVPAIVEQLQKLNCVVLSSLKQMRALVHIKKNFGFDGTYDLVRNVRDRNEIMNLAMYNGIIMLETPELLPATSGGRQGGRPGEQHQGRRRRRAEGKRN